MNSLASKLYDPSIKCKNEDEVIDESTDIFTLEPFEEFQPEKGYFIEALFTEEQQLPVGARYLSYKEGD